MKTMPTPAPAGNISPHTIIETPVTGAPLEHVQAVWAARFCARWWPCWPDDRPRGASAEDIALVGAVASLRSASPSLLAALVQHTVAMRETAERDTWLETARGTGYPSNRRIAQAQLALEDAVRAERLDRALLARALRAECRADATADRLVA